MEFFWLVWRKVGEMGCFNAMKLQVMGSKAGKAPNASAKKPHLARVGRGEGGGG